MYCREHHSITPTTYIARTDPGDWVIAAKKINIIALQLTPAQVHDRYHTFTKRVAHPSPTYHAAQLSINNFVCRRLFYKNNYLVPGTDYQGKLNNSKKIKNEKSWTIIQDQYVKSYSWVVFTCRWNGSFASSDDGGSC